MPKKQTKRTTKKKRVVPKKESRAVELAKQGVPWYKRTITLGRVKTVDIAMTAKHLSVMLSAGLTVPEALEVIAEQSQGTLRRVLGRVNERVQAGESFGDALSEESQVFNPTFISAVYVGEQSGTLDENLRRLSRQLERDLKLRRNVQSAMIYPMVVLTLAVILGFAVATFVLPDIADIFESLRVDLPFTTRALIVIANFFEAYGLIVIPAFFGAVIFLIWFARRKFMRPFVDRLLLFVPVVETFVHMVNRARFCRTSGTLLVSGTPITEALAITETVIPNRVYRKSVQRMTKEIQSGEAFSDIIKGYPNLYPPLIERMVAVGERSASLGTTLEYLADFYEERVLVMSKNLASILEPVLLVAIGAVVALLAASILTPIYSILSAV